MSLGTVVFVDPAAADRVLGCATTVVDEIDVMVDGMVTMVDGILTVGGPGIVSSTVTIECWLLSESPLNLAIGKIGSSSELK